MLAQLLQQFMPTAPDLIISTLYNENNFYDGLLIDLRKCKNEVIIEIPFITNKRVDILMPILKKLKAKGVRVAINTRDPEEHGNYMRSEAHRAISKLQRIGIQVIITETNHRKVAILDRSILWEGSLNILSQYDSREIMRRTESATMAWQMLSFIGIDNYLN